MPERIPSSQFSRLLLADHHPQIALAALIRLRWLAVMGQIAATFVAAAALGILLPIVPIIGVILFTALSNAVVGLGLLWGKPPRWLVEGVLLIDLLALSALLYLTGGSKNPFSALYLVHVAMAVIVLRPVWTWVVVITAAVCYGALFYWNIPLRFVDAPLPRWAAAAGSWVALVLVSVLIAAFIRRIERSLRQREQELADLRDRASRSERLASLTTLAAGAAHELNTPLGTIAIVARELEVVAGRFDPNRPTDATTEESTALAEAVVEDARLIRREVDRCREILQRMRLDIGEGAARRRVQVAHLIADLSTRFREEERTRLKVELAPEVKYISAPRQALEQALQVLVRNAFDASKADAAVRLSVRRTAADGIVFEVADDGEGMSAELLRRAGEPFFTTKEPGRGMGLGLFLVRLVAERCDAEFSIESEVGKGTRAVLELPTVGMNNAPQENEEPAGGAWESAATVKATYRAGA